MKKKWLLFMSMLVAAAITISGTLAYFTAEDEADGVITSGNIKIRFVQQESAFREAKPVMPGSVTPYLVQLENTGDHPAWVRISLRVLAQDGQGDAGPADWVSVRPDTRKWAERDGYYYYTEPVESGEATLPLLEEINFSKTADNRFQNTGVLIHAYAEAVQSENNSGDVWAVKGWPAKEGADK